MTLALIVGLGNPGPRYAATRHNVGFWVVEQLANGPFRQESKFFGEVSRLTLPSQPKKSQPLTQLVKRVENFLHRSTSQGLWLLKPTTFMNRSGQAVAAFTRYYQIPVEQILVIHDDLDFPPGQVRLKQGGGDGKHNGMKDLLAHLPSPQFLRLRIGIGHPGRGVDVSNYVLNPPTRDEQLAIEIAIKTVLATMPWIIAGEINKAMQQLHTQA